MVTLGWYIKIMLNSGENHEHETNIILSNILKNKRDTGFENFMINRFLTDTK